MEAPETLLLCGTDVAELLPLADCIRAVEEAFRLQGEGLAPIPGVLGIHADNGGFHVKAGCLNLRRQYFAAKTNANFPQNPAQGLPLIQGLVLLFDAGNGCLLAAMDSIQITILRTGAATAVAAKYLARPDSKTVTVCGCGNQGRVQLRALQEVCKLNRAFAWDISFDAAQRFAMEMSSQGLRIEPVTELRPALQESDLVVTCTPAETFFLNAEDIAPGTFIAAVGADNPHKQELDPRLLAPANKVVVDMLEQCASFGELHHAIEAGTSSRTSIYAELGDIVCGRKPGRGSHGEITVFDSTGMALQDVASAAAVYENAVATGRGLAFLFHQ